MIAVCKIFLFLGMYQVFGRQMPCAGYRGNNSNKRCLALYRCRLKLSDGIAFYYINAGSGRPSEPDKPAAAFNIIFIFPSNIAYNIYIFCKQNTVNFHY